MNSKISSTGKDVREYCARIGANPLLVQGAGGNISWKEDHTLWIKASGTRLSNAKKEENERLKEYILCFIWSGKYLSPWPIQLDS